MRLFSSDNSNSQDQIECLHGIRGLLTIWLVFTHSFTMYAWLPIQYRATALEVLKILIRLIKKFEFLQKNCGCRVCIDCKMRFYLKHYHQKLTLPFECIVVISNVKAYYNFLCCNAYHFSFYDRFFLTNLTAVFLCE